MMPDKKYPSDLTNEEWKFVEECLHREEEITAGRPLEVALRRVWDAIFILKNRLSMGLFAARFSTADHDERPLYEMDDDEFL